MKDARRAVVRRPATHFVAVPSGATSDARCIENAFAMRAAASLPLGDRRDGDHAPPPPSGASPAPGPGHDAGSWSDLGSDDDEPLPSHSTAANA